MEHDSLPACFTCGLPTTGQFDGRPQCSVCASTAIERLDQVRPEYDRVVRWLAAQGLMVQWPLRLSLGRASRLAREGILTPDHLGVARYSFSSDGSLYGDLQIGIMWGMPAVQFRATLVHELGHALLATARKVEDEPIAHEGFCEALAYLFLTVEDRSAEAMRLAARMMDNRDPVYGDGLRLMWPLVDRMGARHVCDYVRGGTWRMVAQGA